MKQMLAFSAYYEPETASSLYLATNLYESFAANGWHVDLYVPVPTRGVTDEVRKYYKTHRVEKKIDGNLIIHRIFMIKEGNGIFNRALRYLFLNFAFILKGILTKADTIFVQSTPPTQGAMAAIIKKLKRIPIVYNLQDIFPDSLVNAGIAPEGSWTWRVGRKIEEFTYRNADKIIVISKDMKKNILNKQVPEGKISVVYNWVDTQSINRVERKENTLFDEFQLDRKGFYITYAGNLGHSQSIDTILGAAKRLEHYPIRILIFGSGSQYKHYSELIKRLENVSLLPLQPMGRVAEVYSLGNLSIVSCRKGVGTGALPSKAWNIMACATPLLLSFDRNTELYDIVEKNRIGLCSDAEDDIGLANNILTAFNKNCNLELMGNAAREIVEKCFSAEMCVKRYVDIVNSVLSDER